jgi:3-oxoacyl-[acyl-carrier protein] reductase
VHAVAAVVNGVAWSDGRILVRMPRSLRRRSSARFVGGDEGDPLRYYNLGGLQVAFRAMEAPQRQLSMELGQYGIRVVTLRTGGIPESITGDFERRDAIVGDMVKSTMLNRAATLEDVGNVAAFVASDKARSMTAATATVSCGALID